MIMIKNVQLLGEGVSHPIFDHMSSNQDWVSLTSPVTAFSKSHKESESELVSGLIFQHRG